MSDDDTQLDPLDAVRIPDVEDAVLGCLLMDASLLASCDIEPEDFTSADKRLIFQVMRRLGPGCDVATVGTALRSDVNGPPLTLLADLMQAVPSPRGFPTYVRALRELRGAGSTCGGKPVVLAPGQHHVGGGEVCVGTDHFAARALAAIPEGTLYRRGNEVGLIVGEPGRRRFEPLTSDATRRLVDSHVTLFVAKPGDDDPTPAEDRAVKASPGDRLRFVPCSRDLGGLVADAARTHPKVRDLVMLTPFPVYRRDWTLSPPGYSDGVFYDEPPELVGLKPSDESDVLFDLITDFPFKDEASQMNVIGLLLTPIIRHAVGNVPFHLIHSSMERTGKTKLVEAVGLVVTGEAPPAIQVSEREEETEKRITSAMRAGKPLLFFDNLRDFLDSASLAALATAKVWEGRTLGKSELVSYPNRSTVVMTGNNVRATGELVKRTVPILLQPRSDAPEERSDFAHPDLPAWIAYNRRRIWSALIGIVARWTNAGRPAGPIRLGGFEEWAAALSGILEGSAWLGNAKDWRKKADPDGEDLAAFVAEWHRQHGSTKVSASVLATIARENGWFPRVLDKASERAATTAFAMRVLRMAIDRPVGSVVIKRFGSGSSSYWGLDPA